MSASEREPDGEWRQPAPLPYYVDPRSFWRKLVEFPLRLAGYVTYDPLVPYEPRLKRREDGSWMIEHFPKRRRG